MRSAFYCCVSFKKERDSNKITVYTSQSWSWRTWWLVTLSALLKAFLSYLLHCVPVIFKEMNSPGLQVHSGYVDVHLLIYLLLISSQVDQYCGVWFCFVLVVSSFLFSFLSFLPRISSSLLLLHMFAHIRVSHPWCLCVTGSWLSVLGKVK